MAPLQTGGTTGAGAPAVGGSAPQGGSGGAGSGAGGVAPVTGGAAGTAGEGGGAVADECASSPPVDESLHAKCTGSPVSCTFGGDPGHYDVTLKLTGGAAPSHVEAESRRFVVGQDALAPGQSQCLSMTLNVRSPEGQPIQDTAPVGTPGLNLRLVGGATLQAVGVARVESPIVLYIAGDSTVCDQDPQLDVEPAARFTGWGQLLPLYFKRGVSVTNNADSGEGSQAFRVDGGSLWAKIASGLKAGDFVFIQLGHNDKMTDAAIYHSRILGMVQAVKARQATPVLITPMVRNNGDALAAQHLYGNLNTRSELLSIAGAENVALIDLMLLSSEWVAELGRSTAQGYFVGDDATHSNELGAAVFAKMVAQAVADSELGLKSYLR